MNEILHQPAGAGDDGRRRDDRLDEIMQAVIDRRRDDGDERLVDAAERLIETAQAARRQSARQRARAACRSGRPPFSSRAGAAQCGSPTTAARPRSACRQALRLPGPRAEPVTAIDESARPPRRRPACRPPQAAPKARNDRSLAARSAIKLSSPPNRWLAPSTSRKKPSAPLSSLQKSPHKGEAVGV